MMAPFLRVHARRAVLRNCGNLLSTGFPQGGPPFGTAPTDSPYGRVPTIDALGGEIALTSYKYARIIE